MVGSISDMTTAAVVVSAVDSAASSAKKANEASAPVADIQADASYQAEDAPKVAAPAEADTAENEQQDPKDDKRQALDTMTEKFVSEMTKELNELMDKMNCDLEFQYHKEVDVMSVKMINKETKEVIKEYPPEDMVEGMIRAQEWLGAFLDRNA